jgi:hypothetical protein
MRYHRGTPPRPAHHAPSEDIHDTCERALRELTLPRPFSIERLRRQIASERQHLLIIREWDQRPPEAPLAVWVANTQVDVISYAPGLTPWHREHVILHEIAHILLAHHLGVDADLARLAAPGIDPEAVEHIIGRAGVGVRQEQEAELLAALIMQKVRGNRRCGHAARRSCSAFLHPLLQSNELPHQTRAHARRNDQPHPRRGALRRTPARRPARGRAPTHRTLTYGRRVRSRALIDGPPYDCCGPRPARSRTR